MQRKQTNTDGSSDTKKFEKFARSIHAAQKESTHATDDLLKATKEATKNYSSSVGDATADLKKRLREAQPTTDSLENIRV